MLQKHIIVYLGVLGFFKMWCIVDVAFWLASRTDLYSNGANIMIVIGWAWCGRSLRVAARQTKPSVEGIGGHTSERALVD